MRVKNRPNGHSRESMADWPRLAGGPKVPPAVYQWWMDQAQVVAEKEHHRIISIPLLFARVADLDPDLTQEGVNRAQTKKRSTTTSASH